MTYLADNVDNADHFYMVTVLTGMSKNSGTTAKVSISITGAHGTSATHTLDDQNTLLFEAGAEDWFILAEDRNIGKLKGLNVWVDYSNTSPSW